MKRKNAPRNFWASSSWCQMLQNDFIDHLSRKGVLRDPGGGVGLRPRDGLSDIDWVGLTKLTPSGFADELAAFHRLSTVEIDRDRRFSALGIVAGEVVCHPQGCEWCGSTGFRGRQGLFEVVEITPTVRRAIGPKTEAAALEQIARSEGMSTMIEDGVAKCRAGVTTVDEVFRVTASL
jgi:hypothetical protein